MRTVASLVWENLSQEGRSVFHDFASFMRLALADAADYVAHGAEATAESLRQLDTEVQEGQRNDLGVRKRKAEDEDVDTKVKFERTMDKTKDVGSKTIGAGQAALATAQETADRTSSRLQDAFYAVSIHTEMCHAHTALILCAIFRSAIAPRTTSSTTRR